MEKKSYKEQLFENIFEKMAVDFGLQAAVPGGDLFNLIGKYRAAAKTIKDPEQAKRYWDIRRGWTKPIDILAGSLLGGGLGALGGGAAFGDEEGMSTPGAIGGGVVGAGAGGLAGYLLNKLWFDKFMKGMHLDRIKDQQAEKSALESAKSKELDALRQKVYKEMGLL